jgi:acetyl-CoA acetyltransferase
MAIESGAHDVVAVVGAEKMTDQDRGRALRALATAVDIEAQADAAAEAGDQPRPVFMEIYAAIARQYMERSGATQRDFAEVVAKNTLNGSLNPIAQVRSPMSVEEVLAAREIVNPLTRPMCAGIGDGAAAVILCSDKRARELGLSGPKILACEMSSGVPGRKINIVTDTSRRAFERAGVSPRDVDVVELHDAAAPAEVMVPEEIGLVAEGDGPKIVRDGTTRIGGRMPINPSGGLTARGHPIGATGVAQIVELTEQLRGRAGSRQVEGAQIALAENAGGSMPGGGGAACVITILGAS